MTPAPYTTLKMHQGSRKERGHLLLSHLVNGGVRVELGGPQPTQLAAGGNSLLTAPTPQPEAPCCPLPWPPRPSSCPFHRRKQSLSGASLSSSWRNCSIPASRRVEAEGAAGACGPKNTFMWQGRELRLSASHPGRSPQMAAVGEAPHQGQSGSSTTLTAR